MSAKNREKHIGQVFTPDYLVCEMLDYINYIVNYDIINKHIIDNSCGDGSFLIQIVKRYIQTSLNKGLKTDDIILGLEKYIHGIDNDEIAIKSCITNLNNLVEDFGITSVNWDIHHNNTLKVFDYHNKMDFVVGNPPYVRVHNLDDTYNDVKQFNFAEGGMTDLYLVFFEIGFNMLNQSGIMCYITPSSWLSSVAAKKMRTYIVQNNNLISLTDLGHFQPFDGITTYTLISQFSKSKESTNIDYYIFNGKTHKRDFVDTLSVKDILVDKCFYIDKKSNLKQIKEIKTNKCKKYISVKNGFATLSDSSFIGEHIPDTFITIPIIKGSTGKWSKCLFPYDKNGKPISKEIIFSDAILSSHFESEKENLLKGKEEYDGWYLFGRSQAISDVWKHKIVINSLLRQKSDIKISEVLPGCGVYSGLYIIGEVDFETIKTLLVSDEFVDYVRCIKKYKSGGYFTFNTKDVEQFLNYKLNILYNYEQSRFFASDIELF